MQTLRNATHFARLVLAWFVLSLGVAVASPVVKPVDMDLVCSGGSMKLLVKSDDGNAAAPLTLDCPLCASIHAPPPVPRVDAVFIPLLGHAVQAIPSARVAALTAAPPPARGPPVPPKP
jgi:hypothetical protein